MFNVSRLPPWSHGLYSHLFAALAAFFEIDPYDRPSASRRREAVPIDYSHRRLIR